jgi:hypothetical protein
MWFKRIEGGSIPKLMLFLGLIFEHGKTFVLTLMLSRMLLEVL